MKEQITYQDFEKIDIRLGTVISVEKNEKARKPSLVLKQVIGVCNFPEKNIAGVVSQVLILGSIDTDGKVTLVHPSQKADDGLPIA